MSLLGQEETRSERAFARELNVPAGRLVSVTIRRYRLRLPHLETADMVKVVLVAGVARWDTHRCLGNGPRCVLGSQPHDERAVLLESRHADAALRRTAGGQKDQSTESNEPAQFHL